MYNGAFSFNKRNFVLNGQGQVSLTEVFCRVSYALCTWVFLLKFLGMLSSTCCLDGHIGISPVYEI